MNLTEHFQYSELGVAPDRADLVQNAVYICEQLLEPIRAQFGAVDVHDGYRDPGANAQVGGKTASFHLFIGGHAAADIDAPALPMAQLFDWIRLTSGLPFDKVILETDPPLPSTDPDALLEWVATPGVCACVHLQIDRLNPSRRQAFIGQTGAATVYVQVPVH